MAVYQTPRGKEPLSLDGSAYRIDVIQPDKKNWCCAEMQCKGEISTSVTNQDPIVRQNYYRHHYKQK
uniref:FLYWCH-type domain-containing protein n=1 Tax=Romanomermis culicivorax TaxID=13658 RepID=A0A915L1Y2_ROMCU